MGLLESIAEKRGGQPAPTPEPDKPKKKTMVDKIRDMIVNPGPIEQHNRQIEEAQKEM